MSFSNLRTLVRARVEPSYHQPATRAQIGVLVRYFSQLFPDRDDRLRVAGDLLGRDIASFKHLTVGEASALIATFFPDAPDSWDTPAIIAACLQDALLSMSW